MKRLLTILFASLSCAGPLCAAPGQGFFNTLRINFVPSTNPETATVRIVDRLSSNQVT